MVATVLGFCYSLAMPEVPGAVALMEESAPVSGAADAPESGERDAASGRFLDGHEKLGGRKVGARNAAKCLDRAAPKLARHMIARSFKSDAVLCKTMDKILPDAGKESTVVNLALNYAALTIPATSRPTTRMDTGAPSMDSTTTPALASPPSLPPTERSDD